MHLARPLWQSIDEADGPESLGESQTASPGRHVRVS